MSRHKNETLVKGASSHRRTESDYMDVLLEKVSLDDWREVVGNTLIAAKNGDASARAWLAQYLVGKPAGKAPTPLSVVVQRWSGEDPVANSLAVPIIERETFPPFGNEELEHRIRSQIEEELAKKLPSPDPKSGEKTK